MRRDAPLPVMVSFYQRVVKNRIGETLVTALSKTRVPRVVTLSSVDAHLSEGTGPILGLYDLKTKLDTLRDASVIHLRPTYFMENHEWIARLTSHIPDRGT